MHRDTWKRVRFHVFDFLREGEMEVRRAKSYFREVEIETCRGQDFFREEEPRYFCPRACRKRV